MRISSADHFIRTVRSIPDTGAFYERVLKRKTVVFGERG